MDIILIIILLIVIYSKNQKCKELLKENKILMKKLEVIQNQYSKQYETLTPKDDNDDYSKINTYESLNNIVDNDSETPAIKQEHERKRKNIAILATGATCIILSAIVLLMSTWNIMPNLLKAGVLILLTLVFLGGSYLAKAKLKLPTTSRTFFYIAMAYIPICLLSLSILNLVGTYLSFDGEGRYIYLLLVFAFVGFLYYMIYTKTSNKYILYGSILSQLFAIISFTLLFSNDLVIIGISVLSYNIVLMLLTKEDTFAKVYNLIPIISVCLSLTVLHPVNKFVILMLSLLTINFLMLELKNKRSIYSYLFNISLLFTRSIYHRRV